MNNLEEVETAIADVFRDDQVKEMFFSRWVAIFYAIQS